MCDPASIGYMMVGMMAATAMAPSAPGVMPTPPEPLKQEMKQDAKDPNVAGMRRSNTGASSGVNATPASTMLTGTGGVNPNSLVLGRNTLLGGVGAPGG